MQDPIPTAGTNLPPLRKYNKKQPRKEGCFLIHYYLSFQILPTILEGTTHSSNCSGVT